MDNVPAEREGMAVQVPFPRSRETGAEDELGVRQVVGVLRRNLWLLVLTTACGAALAAYLTRRATPVYEASASIRLQEKLPDLPGFFRVRSSGSALPTEAEVLRSRSLAEAAVKELKLQLRLIEPRGVVHRDRLLREIRVEPWAPAAVYELRRHHDGRFVVLNQTSGDSLATAAIGDRLRLPGVAFRLTAAAADHELLIVDVRTAEAVAIGLVGATRVAQAGRDADILRVQYQDTDQELAWRVPNVLVERFIASREAQQKEEARSTVAFLRRQLDTLAGQLLQAENAVRAYRERHLVISPEAEASSQVSRLVTLQAERSTLDGERTALGQLLADVDARAARKGPDDPSPYRQLLAFPTLLRSQAAGDLLNTLSAVEQERTMLLARRTPADPDVEALNGRILEMEGQLRSVVSAYLQGLQNQIATIDSGLGRFGRQIARIPQREIEVARLERQPQVLSEIYTLLQSRLKEAEIAEAAQDPSVRLVDRAIPPRGPVRPRRLWNLAAGLMGGLLVGLALTVARALRDRGVRSRADVQVATGLPMLGLIPRIPVRRHRLALIAEKRAARNGEPAPSAKPTYVPPRPSKRGYTFLGPVEPTTDEPADAPVQPSNGATVRRVLQLRVSEGRMPIAEAYSVLETNIAFARKDVEVKVLVLTSPLPKEGKTTTAVNLAVSLTRRGLSVLLVDADLRRGRVHAAFEAPREPGLSEVLRGGTSFGRACGLVNVEGQTLHFLPSGAPVTGPTALISSSAMRELLERLRAKYDVIILDSPPANIVTDAALLATLSDGAILVARAGMTESGALGVAMDQLRHVGAPLLGVVLNDIDFKRDATYDGAYRYYNYSQYTGAARE